MKNGKKPTKSQKQLLQQFGFQAEDWLIVKNTSIELLIQHRYTGRTRHIPKLRGAAPSPLMQPKAVTSLHKCRVGKFKTEVQKMAKLTIRQQNAMLEAIRQIRELEVAKREVTKAIGEQQQIIKDMMTCKQVEVLELGEYTVRYTTVTTSRFDSAAFKKTHAELYAQYTVPSTSKRFSIS